MKLTRAIIWLTVNAVICVSGFSVSKSSLPINSLSKTRSSTFLSSTTTSASTESSVLGVPSTAFDDGISPFQITTPIYYVNDKPHIGHAYTSTACDVIARFMRLSGREVFFLSGTDEHGQKVEQSAAKKGVDPQDFVDDVSKSFLDLLDLMNISNDEFIRTTSDKHKESVQVSVAISLANIDVLYLLFEELILMDFLDLHTCGFR